MSVVTQTPSRSSKHDNADDCLMLLLSIFCHILANK